MAQCKLAKALFPVIPHRTMATSEPTEITIAIAASPVTTNSTVTETTRLLTNPTMKGDLLKKLGSSVVIRSKAANMILIWSTMVYLIYGTALNPENVFVAPTRLFYRHELDNSPITKLINTTRGLGSLMNMVGSGVYGLIGIWLLFYPLAGYLADVRFGRYKVVVYGSKAVWFGVLVFATIFTALYVTSVLVNIIEKEWRIGLETKKLY